VRGLSPHPRGKEGEGEGLKLGTAVAVKGWSVVFRGERIQADLVAAVLQADGLRVEVFGDHAYGVGVNLTDARVMVPDEQAQTAREVIHRAEQQPAGDGPEV
jgi:Putative prokaryotic signal transducing protein